MRNYDEYANKKYLNKERVDDAIPRNIANFLSQVVIYTILLYFAIKILFKFIFNYKISSYLRPMSFNACIVVSLIEGNIEQFSFWGSRNFKYMFHNNFTEKIFSVFVAIFVYFVVFYTFAGYFLMRYQYGRLFRYFLNNMYRISGASWISSLIFCVRPFVAGCIHSLLYNDNSLQLFLLGLLDFIVFFIMAGL